MQQFQLDLSNYTRSRIKLQKDVPIEGYYLGNAHLNNGVYAIIVADGNYGLIPLNRRQRLHTKLLSIEQGYFTQITKRTYDEFDVQYDTERKINLTQASKSLIRLFNKESI